MMLGKFLGVLAGLAAVFWGAQAAEDGNVECGGTDRHRDPHAPRTIVSRQIVSFELTTFEPQEYHFLFTDNGLEELGEPVTATYLSLKRQADGSLEISARGGSLEAMNQEVRDGSVFAVNFTTPDRGYTARLQDLVVRRSLIRNNGLVVHTYGLPSGDGDRLSVKYDSGEYIYRRINTGPLLDYDTAFEIYDLFRTMTRDQGLDFTTRGSNVTVYDDATEEFLQGIWEGRHFGTPCQVRFAGRHVQITYGGSLTDDTDYVIVDGWVRPDTPSARKGGHAVFSALTGMSKKNSFTLNAGVYRNGASSSFELRKVTAKEEAEAR